MINAGNARIAALFVVVLMLAIVALPLSINALNDARQEGIDEQMTTPTRMTDDDTYSINRIPFHFFEKYVTFKGGSKDGKMLLFKENGKPVKRVAATPGTTFKAFDATLEIKDYDPNTDTVEVLRLGKK